MHDDVEAQNAAEIAAHQQQHAAAAKPATEAAAAAAPTAKAAPAAAHPQMLAKFTARMELKQIGGIYKLSEQVFKFDFPVCLK